MAGVPRTGVSVRLEDDLIGRLDAVRGDLSRDAWCRQVLRAAICEAEDAPYRRQPGPNVEHIRSTSQVKADVVPIPKRS